MKNIKNEILTKDTYRTEVLDFSCYTKPVRLTSAGFFHLVMFEITPSADTSRKKIGDTFNHLMMQGRTTNLTGLRFLVSPDDSEMCVSLNVVQGQFVENAV